MPLTVAGGNLSNIRTPIKGPGYVDLFGRWIERDRRGGRICIRGLEQVRHSQ